MQVFEASMSEHNTCVTAHGKTYFNAHPLNGENCSSSISCPLESFLKNVRGVNITVSFKRHSVKMKRLHISQCSVSISRQHQSISCIRYNVWQRCQKKKRPSIKWIIAIHFGQRFCCTVNEYSVGIQQTKQAFQVTIYIISLLLL